MGLTTADDRGDYTDLYVTAAAWALTTISTVGYGDMYPVSPNEKIFGTLCMIFACGFFAYMTGSIGSILDTHTLINDFE